MGTIVTLEERKTRLSKIIKQELDLAGLQQNTVAAEVGCPTGTFNRYINGSRVFDLGTLEGTTRRLGYEPGHFYDEYFQDLWEFVHRDLHQKVREFLLRCVELNKFDLLNEVINTRLLEVGEYLDDLYLIGEKLEGRGDIEGALHFYNIVIENETDRMSETLALSLFRRFMIVRNWDMDDALEAAIKLGEYIKNIEGKTRFEAYIKILGVFYVLDRWDHLLKHSDELASLIEVSNAFDIDLYVGSLVYIQRAYQYKGMHKEALEVIEKYSNTGIEVYDLWAKGNKLIIQIDSGDYEKVFDLQKFMLEHKEVSNFSVGIVHILNGFFKQNKIVEMKQVLQQFKDDIKALKTFLDPINQKTLAKILLLEVKMFLAEGNVKEAIYKAKRGKSITERYKFTILKDEFNNIIINNIWKLPKNQIESLLEN